MLTIAFFLIFNAGLLQDIFKIKYLVFILVSWKTKDV